VPIKLLLEASLGILDAHQCAQRSLECLTANCTDSREETREFYGEIKGASPQQQFAFLMGPPRYLSRTWPSEVFSGDTSRGQWGETVKRFLTAA
jgi:hypothetical protein